MSGESGSPEHQNENLAANGGTKPEADPEKLMKLLELELAAKRMKGPGAHGDSRTNFRIWSIVVIVVGAVVGLLLLQMMVSQMRPPAEVPPPIEETARP